jgi:hypothetical protein
LVVVEWEGKAEQKDPALLQHFQESLISKGAGELAKRVLTKGHLEKSPSGGVHIHIKVRGECPQGRRLAAGDGNVLAELKAQGNCVVVAPTSARDGHLQAGITQGYSTIIGSPASTPTITKKELDLLCDTLTELLDETKKPEPPKTPRPEVRVHKLGESAVDRYSHLIGWDELLTSYGFTRVKSDGKHTYYDRPDEPKRGSISVSVVGDDGTGTLYVHHTGLTGLEGGVSYTKLGFIAAFDFGGTSDFQLRQAAKYMAQELGDKQDASPRIPDYEEVGDEDETYLDLSWVAEGKELPTVEAESMQRKDLEFLGYKGARINLLYGDPESGKSWILYAETRAELDRGGRVLLLSIDYEDATESVARLIRLEAKRSVIGDPSRFRFSKPETKEALKKVLASVEGFDPTLVVIDSLQGLHAMLGLDSLKDSDVRSAWREYVQPFGVSDSRAVWVIDHLTKRQAQGRNTDSPYGSAAKKQLVRGAMIRAEVSESLAPERVGRVNLYIEKDNSGRVRRVSTGANGYVGCFTLDSTKDETSLAEIASPQEVTEKVGKIVPTWYAAQIWKYLNDNGTQSRRTIKKEVTGKAATLDKALDHLVKGEWVQERQAGELDGKGGGKRYSVLKPYFETEDPASDKYLGNYVYEPNPSPTESQLERESERSSELDSPPIGGISSTLQGAVRSQERFSPEWGEPLPPMGGEK